MQLAQALDLIALKYGALGISLAMFAESAGIPFASALVILTAGKMIATGKVSFIVAVIASSIGITAGSFLSYLIGAMGHRIGRVINTGLSSKRIKKIPIQETKFKKFYDKYGKYSILMGQLFGTTRTFISFPAGVMHMNIFLFLDVYKRQPCPTGYRRGVGYQDQKAEYRAADHSGSRYH